MRQINVVTLWFCCFSGYLEFILSICVDSNSGALARSLQVFHYRHSPLPQTPLNVSLHRITELNDALFDKPISKLKSRAQRRLTGYLIEWLALTE